MNRIIISSIDEPDWNGIWKKADVEKEMKELNYIDFEKNDWINWVLDHVFDEGLSPFTQNAIVEDPAFRSMTLCIDCCNVKIALE